MTDGTVLVYGSYGYTGDLVVRRAVERGRDPVVAGRDARKVRRGAEELGVEARPFALEDAATVADRLADVDVVVNCAGPFVHTFEPVVEACIETGTDYVDVTGEVEVFAAIADRDARAREAGVSLLPGMGFDVVPTDCLAAHLHERLPGATDLALAFEGIRRASPGTAKTAVEHLGGTVPVREGGEIREVPVGSRTREIDFGDGPRLTMAIPWGDVFTAHHTTGIGNVEVYAPVSRTTLRAIRLSRPLGPLVQAGPVNAALKAAAGAMASGPGERARRQGRVRVWGRVEDGEEAATALLHTPEAYEFTVRSVLEVVDRTLAGEAPDGFGTPAGAFGTDLALAIEGVEREDR